MALIPKIKLCLASNCSTLTFRETTGVYNATTNTGGYGTPNIDTTNIVSAVLSVVDPNGVTYTIDLFATGDYPTTNTDLEYTIDLGDLNRTSIEDGYWEFIYDLVDDQDDEYSGNVSYYFYCNTECCVSKLLNLIELDECMCNEANNDRLETYTRAKALLQSLKNAAGCFDTTKFNKIKTVLQKICRNSDCKTCN